MTTRRQDAEEKEMRTTPEPDKPVRPLESDCAEAHTFRCELCGWKRREEDRREQHSRICRQCMEDAGFYN